MSQGRSPIASLSRFEVEVFLIFTETPSFLVFLGQVTQFSDAYTWYVVGSAFGFTYFKAYFGSQPPSGYLDTDL